MGRRKHPFTNYPAELHPIRSKFAITDMRQKPVDLFFCTARDISYGWLHVCRSGDVNFVQDNIIDPMLNYFAAVEQDHSLMATTSHVYGRVVLIDRLKEH